MPLSAFGFFVSQRTPQKLLELAPELAIELDDSEWVSKIATMMDKDLLSPAEMEQNLSENSDHFKLDDILMAFRWFFHAGHNCDAKVETFADEVMQPSNMDVLHERKQLFCSTCHIKVL